MDNKTFTITFGDQAENHVRMQKMGTPIKKGLTIKDLKKARDKFKAKGYKCTLHIFKNPHLNEHEDAGILIIKDGIRLLTKNKNGHKLTFNEHNKLKHDKKAFMYGKVVNKHARHNLCFGDFSQSPDYINGKGRVINFEDLKYTKRIRNNLPKYFGTKSKKLVAEGNYYYDTNKCGIGFHGDTERKIVIAVRLGDKMPIVFQWFKYNNAYGDAKKIIIKGGDMYAMTEKCLGNDWKKSSIYTLRHAAGCKKFTGL